MKNFISFLLLFKFIIGIADGTPTPIVLWHGMGDTCCASYSLGGFVLFLKKNIPDVYVKSLRIGNSVIEDFENGYLMNPNKQVEEACSMLASDTELQGGFNAVGFSQGSQFLRAVVQRCGHKLPPIKNLITLGGQHQGVYGVPHCMAMASKTCNYIREMLNYAAYNEWVQNTLVQATYWHDPLHEAEYRNGSIFIAEINNELFINETYKDNLNRLEHFVMIKFETDSIVQPRDTEWFGFYAPGQGSKLLPLQETKLYLEDRLGLQKMDRAGKLVFLSQPGDHLHFDADWFIDSVIKPYLLG